MVMHKRYCTIDKQSHGTNIQCTRNLDNTRNRNCHLHQNSKRTICRACNQTSINLPYTWRSYYYQLDWLYSRPGNPLQLRLGQMRILYDGIILNPALNHWPPAPHTLPHLALLPFTTYPLTTHRRDVKVAGFNIQHLLAPNRLMFWFRVIRYAVRADNVARWNRRESRTLV